MWRPSAENVFSAKEVLSITAVMCTGLGFGCRIDGGQAEYVRVPYADNGLTKIPDSVTDRQAIFTGDILSTGYWAAKLGEIHHGDTVAVLGAGPTGLCTMMCASCFLPPGSLRWIWMTRD